MENTQFWGEMLGVLKDISNYMEKQDAVQERAKIGTPPKIAENPKPIKGGDMPATFKPADGRMMKEFSTIEGAKDRNTQQIKDEDETLLKEEDEEVVEVPEEDWGEEPAEEFSEEPVGESPRSHTERHSEVNDETIDELKSILKDIRSALSQPQPNVSEIIKSEMKKALPNVVKGETDKMLRKMGFIPTRPDVQKLDIEKSKGIESIEEVKRSEDIKKSKDENDVVKIVEDLSKKSWTELGQLREKTDGFHPFMR